MTFCGCNVCKIDYEYRISGPLYLEFVQVRNLTNRPMRVHVWTTNPEPDEQEEIIEPLGLLEWGIEDPTCEADCIYVAEGIDLMIQVDGDADVGHTPWRGGGLTNRPDPAILVPTVAG